MHFSYKFEINLIFKQDIYLYLYMYNMIFAKYPEIKPKIQNKRRKKLKSNKKEKI